MKYEGHFLLWYLILMPVSKLGFPYITTNILSWLITCIAVWMILKKAPFKFYKRILVILLFPFLYLYPIVSRCYCLIPLAVVLMCIFYKDRKEKPFRYLISAVFLANTHVIMLGMVGIVLLDFLLELIKDWKNATKEKRKKRVIAFIITIMLLVISMSPLIGCLTTNKDLTSNGDILLKSLKAIFYYPLILIMQIYTVFMENTIIMSIVCVAIIVILFYGIKNNTLDYLKIFICILYQCTIYSFIYSSSLQRASTIIFILLYFKWTNKYKETKKIKDFENNIVSICWVILAIINIVEGLLYISYEIENNYSNAYNIAEFINENVKDDSIILSGARVEFTSSIIPYVKKKIGFYHIQGKRYFSYAIWDNQNKIELNMEDIKNLKKIFDKDKKLYYIYCNDKFDISQIIAENDENNLINECIEKSIFKEIYVTDDKSICLESYVMYEVNLNNL